MIEKTLEKILFHSRWVMAPMYFGITATLIALLLKFVQEFIHLVTHLLEWTESEVVISILALVDIVLIGNLLVIVMFSGYENFVSKIELATSHKDRPSWMGKVDYSGLKLKLISSIMAISAIELLRSFMHLLSNAANKPDNTTLAWLVGIHLVFVLSGVLFALTDKLSGHSTDDNHSSEEQTR